MKKRVNVDWHTNLKLLEERLPQIDKTENIMAVIRNTDRSEQQLSSIPINRPNRKKVWYISFIVVMILFACGFGFAAQSWKLFLPNGSVALELISHPQNEGSNTEIDMAALHAMLSEGEAATFYLKDLNRYINLANERVYTSYTNFSSEIGKRAPLNEIGVGFVFQSGSLVHDLNERAQDQTQWKNPNRIGNVIYQLKEFGEASGYRANYKNDHGEQILLSVVFHLQDKAIFSSELNDLDKEKVKIGVTEAFYLKGQNNPAQRMIWGEDDTQSYYRLDDLSAKKMSRERLIDIASLLINTTKSN